MDERDAVEVGGRSVGQMRAVAGVSDIPPPMPVVGKRGNPWMKIVLMLIFGAMGGVFGFWVARMGVAKILEAGGEPGGRGWGMLLVIVVMFLVSWFLTTLVHEAGHAIAGILTGRRVYVFSVGPIWLQRMSDGLRVRWKRLSRSVGGWVLASGGEETVRGWRYSAFLAGGAVANLVVGLPLVWIAWQVPVEYPVKAFCTIAGVLQVMTAVLNLIPLRVGGGIQTDGMALWRQMSGRRDRREEATLLAIHATMGGIRPRDWPAMVVDQMYGVGVEVSGRGEPVHTDLMLYLRAMDVGAWDEARLRLKLVLERYDRLPEVSRGGFAPEVAWFVARVDGDVIRAKQWMAVAGGAMLEKHDVKLAEGGIACLEGRWDDARRLADESEQAMKRPVMVANEDFRDRVNDLRRWVEAASTASTGGRPGVV